MELVKRGLAGLEGILTVDDLVELIAEQLIDLVRLCRRELKHELESH